MKHILYLTLILVITILYVYKYSNLKKLILPTQANKILKDIIELSFNKGSITETTAQIVEVLIKKYKIDYCTILIKNNRGLNIVASNIKDNNKNMIALESYINETYAELEKENTGAKILCSDNNLRYPSANERNVKYMYFIPLKNEKNTIGAMLIENTDRDNIEAIEQDLFKLIISTITIVMQDLIYKDKLSTIALTDGLTGLLNRTSMNEQLIEQLQLHNNINMPFSIALLDIDHFKKVNDTYGHLAGDRCLKQIAAYLKESIRDIDRCYRYGGEEILIFFSRTSNQSIKNRVESIREGISRLVIKDDNDKIFKVTASFGLSEYPSDETNIERLIELADKSLYYSKENGRNRITIYNDIF